MATLTKILVAALVIVLLAIAIGAIMLMYRSDEEPPAVTASPSPLPSATPLAEPNPFGADALNPFEDTEATNPFATPVAEEEYTNPFADL